MRMTHVKLHSDICAAFLSFITKLVKMRILCHREERNKAKQMSEMTTLNIVILCLITQSLSKCH